MSRTDRMIGVVLGVLVGLVALVLFVFLGSSGSIDAPSLDARPDQARTAPQGGDR